MPIDDEVPQLPMPTHLEPKATKHLLSTSVRVIFFQLYNSVAAFRRYLQSVNNDTSVTKNRLFDRYKAVEMIKEAAKKADETIVLGAKEGDIYRIVSRLMRVNGIGLRLRRAEYRRLTHSAPAE